MSYFDYKTVSLYKMNDIELLRELIIKHGSFSEDDYNCCMSRLYLSDNPGRMGIHMKELIRPLITPDQHRDLDPQRDSPKAVMTLFEQKHKASDFTFYNGYIQIENYVLESPKIKKIPSHLLNDIHHEFTIVQEARRPDHFHFVPYSDLSILLNAAVSASDQHTEMIEEEKEKYWKEQMLKQIFPFLLFNHEKRDEKLKAIREEQFDFVSDVLIETSNISSDERYSFDFKFDSEILKVPLDDIEVFDGYVNVNTKNIGFVQDTSWGGIPLLSYKQKKIVSNRGPEEGKIQKVL